MSYRIRGIYNKTGKQVFITTRKYATRNEAIEDIEAYSQGIKRRFSKIKIVKVMK